MNHFKQVTNHTLFCVGHGLEEKEKGILEHGYSIGGHWWMGHQCDEVRTPEGSKKYLGA